MADRVQRALLPALAVGCLLPAPGAGAFRVEEWSATWASTTLSDDFEDGVFAGSPTYVESCGTVQPGDETDGALNVGIRTSPGCQNSQTLSFNFADAGEMGVGARYAFEVPALNQSYGIAIGNVAGTDFASLVVARGEVPILGEAVFVALFDESFPQNLAAEFFPLGLPEELEGTISQIELELTVIDTGSALLPHGRFSIDGGGFVDVPDAPFGVPPDAGALDRLEIHGASITAIPEPGSLPLLALGLAGLFAAARRRAAPR